MAYDMYQEMILQHYNHPQNFGALPHADLSGEESNPLCGDRIQVQLKLDSARHKIEDVRFSGDGCAISVASASLLTQKVKGLDLDAAARLNRDDVLKLVGIPLSPVRVKCALTGFVAFGRALHGAGVESQSSSPVAEGGTTSP
jgi:nitrogen fixation protein NifU and related proteins